MEDVFSVENLASDINSTVTKNVHSAKTTIVLPNPDLTPLNEQYMEWGSKVMDTKIICGKPVLEWNIHFKIALKNDGVNELTTDYLLQKLALINNRLAEANYYLRNAKSKYNEIVTSGTDRYLAEYENIINPNGEVDVEKILNRGVSKEKIKMIAESKNRPTILMAMIALDEKEFFENIVYTLKSTLDIIDLMLRAKGQEIRLGGFN